MKKFIKFLMLSSAVLYILCFPIGVCTAEAVQQDSYYYEDFSGYSADDIPSGITSSALNDSKIYVSEAEVDGNTENVLRLEHNSAITYLEKSLDSAQYITAEIRFRRVASEESGHPSIVLVARSGGTEVFRIYAASNANRVVINSSLATHSLLLPSNLGEVYIEDDIWNTFGIYVNTAEHKAGFKFESDLLKRDMLVDNVNVQYNVSEGLAVGTDFKIDSAFEYIDDIRIFTGGSYQGVFEVDYINIDNKNNPFTLIKQNPAPLPLPLAESTLERLVPDVINVVVNNNVTYYPYYPVKKGDTYYAEYKKTFEALGYIAFLEDNVITAYNDESEVSFDISSGKLNIGGESFDITPGIVIRDYSMIPVTELAEALGFKTRVGDNVIYISENELWGLKMSPYSFRGLSGIEGDNNTYIFHFGTRDNKYEDVGIEIQGKKYKANHFDLSTGAKFGIGIADPSNMLGDNYIITPYYGNTYGTSVTVDKNSDSDTAFYPAYNIFE